MSIIASRSGFESAAPIWSAMLRMCIGYEFERRRFARRLVATTDRVFTFVSQDGPLAAIVRKRVAPIVIPRLLSMDRVRDFIFRTVSQLSLNYREGPLSAGSVGELRGGDRLPWIPLYRAGRSR